MAKQITLNVDLTFVVPDDYNPTGEECTRRDGNEILLDSNTPDGVVKGSRLIRSDTQSVCDEEGALL